MRRRLALLAKLVVSIGLPWWLTQRFELDAAALAPLAWAPLVAGLAAASLQPLVAGIRWHVLLRRLGVATAPGDSVRVYYVGAFAGQFLPGMVGGDAVRIYLMIRHGAGMGATVASALLDRTLGLVGLIVVAMVVALRVEVVDDPQVRIVLVGMTAALAVAVAALMAGALPLERLGRRWPWTSPVGLVARGLRELVPDARVFLPMLAASAGIHLLAAVGLWFALQAFGSMVPLLDVVTVLMPIVLVQMLPISIGGWGTRELMVLSMFSLIGVAPQQALAASVYVGIFNAIAALPGCAAWLHSRRVTSPPGGGKG